MNLNNIENCLKKIKEIEALIISMSVTIEDYKIEYEKLIKIKDHCVVCGTTEFLCGHNKR